MLCVGYEYNFLFFGLPSEFLESLIKSLLSRQDLLVVCFWVHKVTYFLSREGLWLSRLFWLGESEVIVEIMACVSAPPEVNTLRIMLDKIRHIDAVVENWSSDQVDSTVSELASAVKTFPNRRQLKKKTFTENNVTFHDGQPVSVVPGSSNVSESFIVSQFNMCEESERFLTYFHYKWPSNAPVSPSVLAKAGFYYFGVTDTVQCFSCNGRINNWDPGDTAMGEHRRLYPKCKFVQGIDNRNVASRGLLDESPKGTSGKQSPKSEGRLSSEDEAGCSDISKLLKPLTLEESKPTDETQSYFQKELNRLLSFKTWPMASPVDRFDLAAAGFYCVNESNGTVQCFACFGRLSDWKLGDVPRSEHQRLFPSCPFIVGVDTGNVPLTAYDKDRAVKFFAEHLSNLRQPLQIASNLSQSERLSGQSSSSQRSPVNPLPAAAQLPQSTDLTVKYAKYSKYAYEQARLETYGGWPRNHSQIPANLARAGFFATGNGDEVKCFYCGGGLKDWSIGDDPWEEHARWFTRCEWLLQQRGPAFVDSTSRKYGPGDHSYFEPNMGIPSDHSGTLPPVSPPAPHPAPQEVRSAAATAAEPEPRLAEQRKKKGESKKQGGGGGGRKQHPEKKKQGRKNKPISERVAELFKSDVAQFMVDMGQDETIIRTVLRKRLEAGQSPFQTSEELLVAIFDEEENQQRGAINNEPAEIPASPKRRPEKTTAVKEPEKQKLPKHVQKTPEKETMQENPTIRPLFGQFKVEMAGQLTRRDCVMLATYFSIPPRYLSSMESSPNPGLKLLQHLEERGVIQPLDVSSLQNVNLIRAAILSSEYQQSISRLEKVSVSSGEERLNDDFPASVYFGVIETLSEHVSRANFPSLCAYFALAPSETEAVIHSEFPARQFLVYLHKRGTIKPDDMTFLVEGLKEVDLVRAANKVQAVLQEEEEESEEEEVEETEKHTSEGTASGDMAPNEVEKLREKNLCKICLDQDVEMLFLPCKHLVTCSDCAERVNVCPICRTEIDDKLYVFMP